MPTSWNTNQVYLGDAFPYHIDKSPDDAFSNQNIDSSCPLTFPRTLTMVGEADCGDVQFELRACADSKALLSPATRL
jgi:hypothetical protein